MNLYLIRHGQTEGDLKNVIECNADFELSELGYQQAKLLIKELEKYSPFDFIYSSNLKRAKNTAKLIAENFGLNLIIDKRINEKNVGLMAGLSREEAFKKFPLPNDGLKVYQKMGGGTGESLLEMEFRVKEFFSELLDKNKDKTVIVISHGGTIDLALKFLLKANHLNQFCTGDVGIHNLKFIGKKLIINFLNKEIV